MILPMPTPQPPSPGYYILVALNAIGLFTAVGLFLIEITGDPSAAQVGASLGVPILIAQTLLGSLPSWIYLGARRHEMTRGTKATLFTLSLIPPLLELGGIILSRALSAPRA